ncbi:MAG: protein kinase (serine/threonine-protein kinase)-like protein, partial [Ramlibacter sp.]|nr:protein kinase (serine/threonine-protein kinase)-like protein [Ramlibacter sp.]
MSLKKLGRYDLVRVLGKGAMGVVYEGRDPNLERRVAIKTVKVENLSEEAAAEYEARFRTEARSAARLQHPNIVSVYDSDRDIDIAFLVMEYIQGDDLKHHIDRGVRYSLEQSLKMIRDLLAALDYAHKQGIVHRDIKPANLLIEPGGRVKLTDFGVARIQDSGDATRTQGSMVGTLKYMAPEQVQGLKIDSRADLFSVGVVLYQLLTDKRPFDGDNDFSIIHQIIGHTPPAPSSINPRLPTAIDAVVARALAKDREQRFATARDFASALQSAIRRAEDATVLPPADPLKKPEAAATSKGTVPSMIGSATSSGTSGSTATVTQELELVYWKDIKDSADPEELQGFLQQFPAGIYADLARRRLRKLATGSSADQTMLTGQTRMGAPEVDLEATRVRSDPSIPMAAPLLAPASAAAATFAAAPAVAAPVAAVPPPVAVPVAPAPVVQQPTQSRAQEPASPAAARLPEAAAATAVAAPSAQLAGGMTIPPQGAKSPIAPPPASPPAVKPKAPRPEAKPQPAAATAKKKPPVAVLAGLGALAVAGIAAFMMMGRPADKDAAAVPPLAAASQPASAAAVTPP